MSAAEEEREPDEADADVPAREGDRVAVEYHSAHVDRRKVLVGEVMDVVLKGAPRDGEWVAMLAEIYVRPEDGHRNDRSEHYTETTRSAMRRVTWEIEEDEDRGWHSVEARNGLRWNRVNETGTRTEISVLAAEEEPPHPDNGVVLAVGLRCHRCNGTSCKEVTDPETEPLTGTRWACPHCHEVDDESGAEIGQQYEILGCKPVSHVDTSWSLAEHEALEWAASPTRWRAFTETVLKGRKATEYAEDVDVTPGTVYRHVHDAREVLKGGLNE